MKVRAGAEIAPQGGTPTRQAPQGKLRAKDLPPRLRSPPARLSPPRPSDLFRLFLVGVE